MKKILIMVVAVLGLAGCTTGQKNDNTFVIGSDCGYAPYSWTTTSEQKSDDAVLIEGSNVAYCDGYDIKIATQIAKQLNKELVVKKISFEGLIPALQANEIDVILSAMSPTQEREQVIGFTAPYYVADEIQAIMVKKDSPLAAAKSLADFDGTKISAQLGTLQMDLLVQILNVVDTTSLETYGDLIQALKSNAIDGYVVDSVAGGAQLATNDDFVLVVFEKDGFVLTEEQTTVSIGLKKDNTELKEMINTVLNSISQAERKALMEKTIELSDSLN